jgi:hypothetical protein
MVSLHCFACALAHEQRTRRGRSQLLLILDALTPSLFGRPLTANEVGAMTPASTASANERHRLLLCLLMLLALVFLVPGNAQGKGGTNMHEKLSEPKASEPTSQPPLLNEGFGGCGRGRYRDPRTHKCRGPADFGN